MNDRLPRKSACPACGDHDLLPFYEVHSIPVHSCLMVDSRAKALAFPKGDLGLALCRACGFIFNQFHDPSLQDYTPDYEETQAFSPRFQRFLEEICDDQDKKYALGGKTVLEIGCGKGEFLVALAERTGARCIGIDPGYRPERTVSEAADRLTFIQDYYGPAYAHLAADYVSCRHTLEHIGEVGEFMRLIRKSIGDRERTIIFFELPAIERVLEECAFWDIYYEHCSYFSGGSLARLFRRSGFVPHALWKAYDDQYLMLEATPGQDRGTPVLAGEDDLAGLCAAVDRFATEVSARRASLRADLLRWRDEGKNVALWGSGSKAVSYLTTLDAADLVGPVVDINPHKWGKFLAGAGNEIVSPASLRETLPDVVIAMNPIYLEEIARDLGDLGIEAELQGL